MVSSIQFSAEKLRPGEHKPGFLLTSSGTFPKDAPLPIGRQSAHPYGTG